MNISNTNGMICIKRTQNRTSQEAAGQIIYAVPRHFFINLCYYSAIITIYKPNCRKIPTWFLCVTFSIFYNFCLQTPQEKRDLERHVQRRTDVSNERVNLVFIYIQKQTNNKKKIAHEGSLFTKYYLGDCANSL